MAIEGSKIFISLGTDTTPVAFTRSNEINTACERVETSTPNSDEWREFIPGRQEWSFSTSFFVGNSSGTGMRITDLLRAGTIYTVNIYERDGSSTIKKLTGQALCTRANARASVGTLVQGAFAFVGTGPLTEVIQT